MRKAIDIALSLKKQYKTKNPFILCDYLNIDYLYADLPPHIKGFYSYISNNKFIFLNNQLRENQKKLVCAHELGHAILHTNSNAIFLSKKTYHVCSKFEHEADTFCAYLLLDDIEQNNQELVTIDSIACETGIPKHIVEIRYREMEQTI